MKPDLDSKFNAPQIDVKTSKLLAVLALIYSIRTNKPNYPTQ